MMDVSPNQMFDLKLTLRFTLTLRIIEMMSFNNKGAIKLN